jgi:hypothetical protein
MEAGIKFASAIELVSVSASRSDQASGRGESLTVLAKSYDVTHPTIIRALQRHEATQTGAN